MHPLLDLLQSLGLVHPAALVACFVAASLLILWRVEALLDRGLEGTAIGTLVLPYCSGLGNLVFVALMLRDDGPADEVMVNSVVNNATNLTVLLAVPALIWGLPVVARPNSPRRGGSGRGRKSASGAAVESRLSRLSLLLTLSAVLFFTAAVWLLGEDGQLGRTDGLMLVGLFLFWQSFQVFDALKHNVRRSVTLGPGFLVDLLVIAVSAWVLYESLDWLVDWIATAHHGFFRAENLGWITGWLLVLPNALVAFFYAARGRADIVYSSQVGDGHICLPLGVGLFALVRPLPLPPLFLEGLWLLLAAAVTHALCLIMAGRLPRWVALGLLAAYAWFLLAGLRPATS